MLTRRATAAMLPVVLLAACAAASAAASPQGHTPQRPSPNAARQAVHRQAVGLGATLMTKDGGQIFGFDIDQNGNDGVLASAQTISSGGGAQVSVETFDQDTGKITKSFEKYTGKKKEFEVDAIFAGDVALVTHYVQIKNSIFYRREYDVMNPVTAEKFTGVWTAPIKDANNFGIAENQSTSTAVMFAYHTTKNASLEKPDLIVTNVAANTSKVFPLNSDLFDQGNGAQIGQYTAANQAVFALSPDGGAAGGSAPINVLVDLTTGKHTQFNGLNNGEFGAGDVNGLAVDPNTGIAATTTQLNAQVEFYDLTKQTGTFAQLPCTGNTDEENAGSGIAVDPINKLFLVSDYFYCAGSEQSAIVVYDENGNFVEAITGFPFTLDEPAAVINPSKRMGWALGGNGDSQLRQFFY
jgi:hypothetical protein